MQRLSAWFVKLEAGQERFAVEQRLRWSLVMTKSGDTDELGEDLGAYRT